MTCIIDYSSAGLGIPQASAGIDPVTVGFGQGSVWIIIKSKADGHMVDGAFMGKVLVPRARTVNHHLMWL